jgi:Helix-turn-helix domain
VSVDCLSWVFKHSESEGTARLVLLVLADHAGQGGWVCYPSIKRIAERAKASESAVHRAIRTLVELGEVEIDRQGAYDERIRKDKRPNLYRIIPTNGVPLTTPGESDGVSLAKLRGVAGASDGVPPVAPKPSLEPSMNREKNHPKDGFARFPVRNRDCDGCGGSLMVLDENDIAARCEACA